jgi:hypothetical protein
MGPYDQAAAVTDHDLWWTIGVMAVAFFSLLGFAGGAAFFWLGVRQVVRWIELGRLREKRRKAKEGQGVLEFERKAGA